MILKPFTVTSGGVEYRFVVRQALDSEAMKLEVDELVKDNHAFSQFEAMCQQLGLAERGPIPNMRFAVLEAGSLVGIWGLANLGYISGPWDNTADWNVTDPGAPARWSARPMPGIRSLPPADELELAVDTAAALLDPAAPFLSMEDTSVGFSELLWAVNKTGRDPVSLRARAMHAKAEGDARFDVTESQDPVNPVITLAKLKLR